MALPLSGLVGVQQAPPLEVLGANWSPSGHPAPLERRHLGPEVRLVQGLERLEAEKVAADSLERQTLQRILKAQDLVVPQQEALLLLMQMEWGQEA